MLADSRIEIKLSEVLAEKGYIRGPFGSALRRPELKDAGIPVYEQQHAIYNIRDFRFFIDEDKFKELERFQVRTNDLIISCSGTVGRISLIRDEDPKGIISQALLLLRPNQNIIRSKYLYYYLTSKTGFNQITQASHGSVQVNIASRNVVEAIKLNVPAVQEQDKIVNMLASIDGKIELNLEMNKTLEEMAMAIYKEWFVDFGPFKDGGFVESELGMIPRGWEIRQLKEFSRIIMGQSPSSKYYNQNDEGLPFHQGVTGYGWRYPTNTTFSTDGNRIAEQGDILFSVRAPVGRINIAGSRMILGRGLAGIRHVNNKNHFLFYTLKRFFTKDDIIGDGTVYKAVNKNDVESLEFLLPDTLILNKFTEIIEPFDSMIESNTKEIETLKETRDYLLPKLITGEIRVKEAEKEVEKVI